MGSMEQLGKLILLFAGVLAVVGVAMIVLGKIGVPKLPGDIFYKRDNVTVYIPIATMIAVSVVLTILLNLIFWLFRR